ncbi:MAG: hypothetical protein ACRBB0_26600 [Pelagimonas sp.]|uniref:hypothetical protein n=1 Tax=Pelagimonas sp. TaxID=2073170 RepID=UPI003D6A494B
MDALIPLDVILNEGRKYVQGTQLIARGGEALAAKGLLADGAVVHAAGFHSISDRTVSLRVGASQDGDETLGTISFRTASGEKTDASFVAGSSKAPDGNVPPQCKFRLKEASGPLDATFHLEGVSDTEQFLVALIQTVKVRHEMLTDTVSDVWFTGLRGADIPLSRPFPVAQGHLSISFRRMMQSDNRWQTLLSFDMKDPEGARILRGTLTFAFKSETKPDVD